MRSQHHTQFPFLPQDLVTLQQFLKMIESFCVPIKKMEAYLEKIHQKGLLIPIARISNKQFSKNPLTTRWLIDQEHEKWWEYCEKERFIEFPAEDQTFISWRDESQKNKSLYYSKKQIFLLMEIIHERAFVFKHGDSISEESFPILNKRIVDHIQNYDKEFIQFYYQDEGIQYFHIFKEIESFFRKHFSPKIKKSITLYKEDQGSAVSFIDIQKEYQGIFERLIKDKATEALNLAKNQNITPNSLLHFRRYLIHHLRRTEQFLSFNMHIFLDAKQRACGSPYMKKQLNYVNFCISHIHLLTNFLYMLGESPSPISSELFSFMEKYFCSICGIEYKPRQKKQFTCGNEACKKAYNNSLKQQKRTAGVYREEKVLRPAARRNLKKPSNKG